MYKFPEGHALQGTKQGGRVREDTILQQWMVLKGRSCRDVANGIGASTRAVKYWKNGQMLPSIITAFKIEQYTKGAVSVESWLSTAIAKAKWNQITKDGKNHEDKT